MTDRKIAILYKNIIIHVYKNSNYAYVGKRVFNSLLGAKRHITKVLSHFNNDKEATYKFYLGVK